MLLDEAINRLMVGRASYDCGIIVQPMGEYV